MALKITPEEAEARRVSVLEAARWCFLNFGFSKTSLDDIAKRANISRTLLYRTFKDKEDIFAAVFEYWLISRHPQAKEAAAAKGSVESRLLTVCKVMVFEPWEDMVGAPMAADFYDVCNRLNPEVSRHHEQVVIDCMTAILGDADAAKVIALALNGLLADRPSTEVFEARAAILINRFSRPPAKASKQGSLQ